MPGIFWSVERYAKSDQACALAVAAAQDFNDELTVILSSISTVIAALDPDNPARGQALELQKAARRCAQKTSGLLRFGVRRGNRLVRTSLLRLIEDE